MGIPGIPTFMNSFVIWLIGIIEHLGPWAYFLLGIITVLESLPIVGLLIPGGIILIVAGVATAWHVFNFYEIWIICSIAGLIGDLVSFYIGRRLKLSNQVKRTFLKPEYLDRAETFEKRWGSLGVVSGRFFGVMRSVVSVVAGTTKMSWLRFIILSCLGSVLFSLVHVGFGYLAANAWQTISSWSSRLGLVLLLFAISVIILWWFKGFLVRQGRELKLLVATLAKRSFERIVTSLFWHWLRKKLRFFTDIFERRFSPNRFKGLPLLSLLICIIACISLTWWIGVAGLNPDSFWFGLDERLRSIVILFSDYRLAVAAFLITVFGSTEFIIVASLFLSFWLILEHRKSQIIGLWIAVGGSILSGVLIKLVFAKPRPDPTFYFENFYAFPSLHATLSTALLMYFAYYAIKAYPRWSRNISLVLAMSFMAITIGFSRIYLGVHYPSDVVGGWLLGLAWFIVGIIFQRLLAYKEKPRRLSRRFKIWTISSIVLLLFSFYINQTFSRGVLKNFYYSLPALIAQRSDINLDKVDSWPPFTENWRGGRLRPISALIFSNEKNIRDGFINTGWEERSKPDLPNLLNAGTDILLKRDSANGPVRPRFWHNNSNDFAFVKRISDNGTVYEYSARLWKVKTTNNQEAYVVELLMTKNFILDLKSVSSERINEAQKILLKDLSEFSSFKELSKINYHFKTEEQIEERNNGFEITLYVISL